MGRGGRDNNQALRIAALPRRFATPQRLGQKRYFVDQVNTGYSTGRPYSQTREPGYIRTTRQELGLNDLSRGYAKLVIREEIVARDKEGNLGWIPAGDVIGTADRLSLNGWGDLAEARALSDKFNQNPLGHYVEQGVDQHGNLSIGLYNRYFDWHSGLVNESVNQRIFDVSDSEAATEAKAYYKQLEEQLDEAKQAELASAVRQLHQDGGKEAERFFIDDQASARAREAEALSAALDDGRGDEFLAKDKPSAEEQAARAAETIRSLASS